MNVVRSFLHRHGMDPADISYHELTGRILTHMEHGLSGQDTSIPMLPSYLYTTASPLLNVPTAVIDAGGTNFRRALVTLTENGAVVEEIAVHPMPGTNGEASWKEFISCCADAVEPLLTRTKRIGICFSYSFTPTPDGDGRVIQITKEVLISNASGRPICADLSAELAQRGYTGLRFALINDTLAVQLGVAASMGLAPDTCMGMVCGTGSNVCCAIPAARIAKLGINQNMPMLVNTESGFFTDVPQGDYDRALDAASTDPGHALSEKMVSGAYLGELCLLTLRGAAKEGIFSPSGAALLNHLELLLSNEADTLSGSLEPLSKTDKAAADEIIAALFDRSAKVMCCTLSAVLRLTGQGQDASFHIGAEGSLFQKSRRFRPALERHMEAYARAQLGRSFDFCTGENTTLTGAACAVLL